MMEALRSLEHGESIPFSRACLAAVVGQPASRVNNWIDRNLLWRSHRGRRFHRSYTIREAFDLAGFAALRAANIPEKECARYVYNYGFYQHFLHGDQLAGFGLRNGRWTIGFYDRDAEVSIVINMRTLGQDIFLRLADALRARPQDWPDGSLASFRQLYREAVRLGRLDPGAAPPLERAGD